MLGGHTLACMHACARACTLAHTSVCTHTHTCVHAHTHTHTHTHVCAHTHTHRPCERAFIVHTHWACAKETTPGTSFFNKKFKRTANNNVEAENCSCYVVSSVQITSGPTRQHLIIFFLSYLTDTHLSTDASTPRQAIINQGLKLHSESACIRLQAE